MKVKVLCSVDGNNKVKNAVGTILETHRRTLVEFDKDIGGHDGYGRGRYGYCWLVSPEQYTSLSRGWKKF